MCNTVDVFEFAPFQLGCANSRLRQLLFVMLPVLVEELNRQDQHTAIFAALRRLFIRVHVSQQFAGRRRSWLVKPLQQLRPFLDEVKIESFEVLLDCSDIRFDAFALPEDCFLDRDYFLVLVTQFQREHLERPNNRSAADVLEELSDKVGQDDMSSVIRQPLLIGQNLEQTLQPRKGLPFRRATRRKLFIELLFASAQGRLGVPTKWRGLFIALVHEQVCLVFGFECATVQLFEFLAKTFSCLKA